MTELLKAFLVGGLLCVIGQLLIDKTKLMSGRILVLYVCIGCILGGLGMSLSGCGHSVDVTPNRAEVCKDGSCLVIEQGHISYSQAQPVTDVPPVVQIVPSKK